MVEVSHFGAAFVVFVFVFVVVVAVSAIINFP